MEETTKSKIESIARKSYAGELIFGDVVGLLIQDGVESYFADFRTGITTYYFNNGSTCQVALGKGHLIPAEFNAGAIKAAILAAQKDEIRYPEFIRLSVAAGCVGYIVWIAGGHVSYFGHHGEVHVELFPKAA